MANSNLVPDVGERSLVVGTTGSGKSTLVWVLACIFTDGPYPGIVIDTKPDLEVWPGWGYLVTDPDEALARFDELHRIVYRPDPPHNSPRELDNFLFRLYQQRTAIGKKYGRTASPCLIILDEAYQCFDSPYPLRGYRNVTTSGRQYGMTTITSSQRLAGIPRFCRTESDMKIIGLLEDPEDRKTAGRILGISGDFPELPPRKFMVKDSHLTGSPAFPFSGFRITEIPSA